VEILFGRTIGIFNEVHGHLIIKTESLLIIKTNDTTKNIRWLGMAGSIIEPIIYKKLLFREKKPSFH